MKSAKTFMALIVAGLFALMVFYYLPLYRAESQKLLKQQHMLQIDRMLVAQMLKTLDFELEPLPIQGQFRAYYPDDRSKLVLCTGEEEAECWIYESTDWAKSKIVNK